MHRPRAAAQIQRHLARRLAQMHQYVGVLVRCPQLSAAAGLLISQGRVAAHSGDALRLAAWVNAAPSCGDRPQQWPAADQTACRLDGTGPAAA